MKTKLMPIGFRVSDIKTDQFATFPEHYRPEADIQLKTDLQFMLCGEEKSIAIVLGFAYEQESKVIVKIEVRCIFNVKPEDYEALCNNSTHKITFPKHFAEHLSIISIGTTRGILFAKTEGTEFAKFILPTINVREMVQDDIVFEIQ